MTVPAKAALKPGDVLAVRTGGLAGKLIRLGEAFGDKPNTANHIAIFHHYSGDVPWGLEGRPGGVGWADLRGYLANPFTFNNCGQPGRDDAHRTLVAELAKRMIGSSYDWSSIADDTLRAFHMPDLFASTFHGVVPGHVVCSSFAAFLYERVGWGRPHVSDRDTEPSDWCDFILANRYNVSLPEGS